MVKTLLVYPENPKTFWSYHEALKIAGKKSVFPPNGLLTVAGMLSKDYDLKLIDTNVEKLKDKHLNWADIILSSAMIIHKNSLEDLIKRANEHEKPIIVGGPLPTQYHDRIKGNATFYLGESESGFDKDILERIVSEGYQEKSEIIDMHGKLAEMDKVPSQRSDLLKKTLNKYAAMAVQISRGCPESCSYCDIPILYGKKTRLKKSNQVLSELTDLYDLGWQGMVMLVDDNFVGNQEKIIPILEDITQWQKERGYPFSFLTQAALRMQDNPKLLESMYTAGFHQVFIGLESPSKESLKFMGAQKNLQSKNKLSMIEKVIDIQEKYFKVQAGLILGFDSDPDNIADMMKELVYNASIGVAMAGPLGILKGTPDYKRYKRQDRLVEDVMYAGDSGVITRKLSYIPKDKDGNKIDPNVIFDRHRDVLSYINDPKNIFQRNVDYLKNRTRKPIPKMHRNLQGLASLLRSVYYQGLRGHYKREYWNYIADVVSNDITDIPAAIGYAAESHHLITTTRESLKADDVNTFMDNAIKKLGSLKGLGQEYIKEIAEKYDAIRKDFKDFVEPAYRVRLESVLIRKENK